MGKRTGRGSILPGQLAEIWPAAVKLPQDLGTFGPAGSVLFWGESLVHFRQLCERDKHACGPTAAPTGPTAATGRWRRAGKGSP